MNTKDLNISSNSWLKYAIVCMGLFAVLAGLWVVLQDSPNSTPTPQAELTEAEPEALSPIEEKLNSMTLQQKVGQLLFIGYDGSDSNAQLANMVTKNELGGVMLMGVNTPGAEATVSLVSSLQSASSTELFIGIDQEGGIVSRLQTQGFELTAQPLVNSAEQAAEVGANRAKELSALGVNTNFSPVLEKIDNPNSFLYQRVFRGDSRQIAELGSSVIESYQSNGLLATAKHFPGHSNSSVDSHLDLPVINLTDQEFEKHVEPFAKTFQQSEPRLVMISHTLLPSQDPTYPASLSPAIIKYLRDDMDYSGLIITDDLSMQAVTKNYELTEAAVLAVNAGVDILLMVEGESSVNNIANALVAAVENGKLSEERVNEAVRNILTAKSSLQ